MSVETRIVAAAMADRKAFDSVRTHCDSREFSPLSKHWLDSIESYYSRDKEADSCDAETLQSLGLQAAGQAHHDNLLQYFKALPTVSAPNVIADILTHKRDQLGLQIAVALSGGKKIPQEELNEMLAEYQVLAKDAEAGLISLDVLDVTRAAEAFDASNVIPLYPSSLAKRLQGGGALPGHHIVIMGRPEAGKSLFSINMACGMVYKGKKVVYYGNEEDVLTHYIRAACNLAGADIRTWDQCHEQITAKANEHNLQALTFVRLTPGTLAEVEQGVQEFNPHAIFVDQLAGLDVGCTRAVESVEKAARGVRTIVLKHGVVGVSVCQAGDKTEKHGQLPPAFLQMNDVYGSRTGIPAHCDLLIGVGYDQDMYDRDIRGISLPKNKLGGVHAGFKVRIDTQKSKVLNLG